MVEAKSGTIRVGIGGWTFEPWRGAFYPEGHPQKAELHFASRKLTTIEINGTYYRTQSAETFAKWRDETPDDFVFAVKASRYATNRRVLAEAGESVERFCTGGILALGPKLGPINWQFMATKRFDPDDFGAFLELLPKEVDGRPLRHAVEVRHESFVSPDFVALAREHGVAIVAAGDAPHPLIPDPTAPFVYARIMGTKAGEAAGYPPAGLDRWADAARAWSGGGLPEGMAPVGDAPQRASRDVFLYVIGGHKVANPAAAMALIERLA